MNSSAKTRRVYRPEPNDEDVFVVGSTARAMLPTAGVIANAQAVIEAADVRAAEIIAEAEVRAAATMGSADAVAGDARDQAFTDGYEAGRAEALAEFDGLLSLARQAAQDGKALRDGLAEQHIAVVGRAAAIATRRIVAAYYEADPQQTLTVCAEALRAAAGQEVLTLRVHPSVAGIVQATLSEASGYVRPDESVEVGGCIVDLRHGTIDASLDARLSLMDLALSAAAGEPGA
jgi:flagellar biosynthesis/type III secretory pathway protein FliH